MLNYCPLGQGKLFFAQIQLLVDAGYVNGKNIIDAQDQGVELVEPLPGKPTFNTVSLADFDFNENCTRIERCPNQKSPMQQGDTNDKQGHWAEFSKEDCSGSSGLTSALSIFSIIAIV